MTAHLQALLHDEIPLTRAIGLVVDDYADGALTLGAPLDNNINHKCTAFGGSLYSLAVLSGWGLVHLALRESGLSGHVVIQESRTRFLKPVDGRLTARCGFVSPMQRERFLRMYERKGIARIELESRIVVDSVTHVIFNGRYVVHR